MICSASSARRWSSSRSGPLILIPTGVLMPVESMSIRVLMGIVQVLARPGKRMAASISRMRSDVDLRGSGHSPFGFSCTTVSIIDRGAGSVAVSARPILPKTDSTSGNVVRILSVCCSNSSALVMETPGNVVGM